MVKFHLFSSGLKVGYNRVMNSTSPISRVAGIGPVFEKLLAKLEIYTVGDLLYHFPFRYDDFASLKEIAQLIPNETVTINALLISIDNIFTRYGKKLTKAKISDETGELSVIWFNQHYIKKSLSIGERYIFSGKVQPFSGKLTLVSPVFEKNETESLNTQRLVPIYSETAGITSKWLRSKINDILKQKPDIPEILTKDILLNEKFYEIEQALNAIHFPENLYEAEHARNRFIFEELFTELLKVEMRKDTWEKQLEGVPLTFDEHGEKITAFKSLLPFKLTESQVQALEDIYADLAKKHPMNRILEGDVGSGKTIVALLASYLTYLNGYKTLYMAPTEILANQHFETFKSFFSLIDGGKMPSVILKTSATKESILDCDIAIGTHALLHSKEQIQKVGLVVIDEQHRFGVEQRAKLLELGEGVRAPNLLTMTATPIPRTLTLTVYGDLAISTLETPAEKVRQVTTRVIPENKRDEIFSWILAQNKPTFIVCPFIEGSEAESLENVKSAQVEFTKLSTGIFKNVSRGLLHGRMKQAEKQEVITKFKTGEIQILVSTPVIEVGIDIPEASIMVIESAERYGLASLHQLRGRVGRDGNEGHCLLFLSGFSKTAYGRLKHLETITDGLELAEIDLKLRGSGDVYGVMQSGYKQFKLADLSDLTLLKKVKVYAQDTFRNIDKYPNVKNALNGQKVVKIGKN